MTSLVQCKAVFGWLSDLASRDSSCSLPPSPLVSSSLSPPSLLFPFFSSALLLLSSFSSAFLLLSSYSPPSLLPSSLWYPAPQLVSKKSWWWLGGVGQSQHDLWIPFQRDPVWWNQTGTVEGGLFCASVRLRDRFGVSWRRDAAVMKDTPTMWGSLQDRVCSSLQTSVCRFTSW